MCACSRSSIPALLAAILLICSPGCTGGENNSSFGSVTLPVGGGTTDPGPLDVYSTGLPVVEINTEGGAPIVSKEDYLAADFRIVGKSAADDLGPLSCSVRGRGNTTWTWPKKPYLVKLDSKASLA